VVSNLLMSDIWIFNVAFVTPEFIVDKLRFELMQSGPDIFRWHIQQLPIEHIRLPACWPCYPSSVLPDRVSPCKPRTLCTEAGMLWLCEQPCAGVQVEFLVSSFHFLRFSLSCPTAFLLLPYFTGSDMAKCPRVLDLGTCWRWVVGFTPVALYPRAKNPRYSLDRTQGGPQNRSGWRGEEKNLAPTGTRTPTPRPSSP
jgi:hypothetical protein